MSIQALSIAATGMQAQQQNVDIIANNIANVNTNGFKKQRAEFTDLFYQNLREAGSTALKDTQHPTGIQLGTGVQLVATKRLFTPGIPIETGNQLDLLIDGQGFFQVKGFEGTTNYTRNGSFSLDKDGRMLTSDGFLLEPNITISGTDVVGISISKEGVVEAKHSDGTKSDEGTIQLATFVNPAGLTAIGDSLFAESDASGDPVTGDPGSDGLGSLRQNFVEGSNVDVVKELVSMISAQRAFELNSNSIQTADDMLQVANNLRR